MKFGIISDDLTGANDSGVQLARYGLKTYVRFDINQPLNNDYEVVVLDTDSRSIPPDNAYQRVKESAKYLQQQGVNIIYKKIDSTLRGNIGIEIDAVYDAVNPHFVVIAPAYPKNGRKVVSGFHYLHERLLHETEIVRDPKTPVKESSIPLLIQQQTNRKIGHIDLSLLSSGYEQVKSAMDNYFKQKIPYLLFDSETEDDLALLAEYVHKSQYNVVWLGSAGLANYLPGLYGMTARAPSSSVIIPKSDEPILLVAGSVSSVARKQLDSFLANNSVKGIKLNSAAVVSDETRNSELKAALENAKEAFYKGYNVALYSAGEAKDIAEAQLTGAKIGIEKKEVSNIIVKALGELTDRLLASVSVKGIILTGGDTAKQVCKHIGGIAIQLYDEIETGVPIGKLIGRHQMFIVTKAGAFGTDSTFVKSMKILQGS